MIGDENNITRRALTVVFGLSALGALAKTSPDRKSLQRLLVLVGQNRCFPIELGHACSKALCKETFGFDKLTDDIIMTVDFANMHHMSIEAVQERLVRRIRYEFAKAEVINVDGWMLSPTETRLYALATLNSLVF